MFKKFVKKTFKSMKKILKNPGRAIKKGLGKIGKAFGKLGPIGTIALSLMMPGLGAAWTTFGTYAAGTSGAMGAVLQGIATAGNAIGSVYSSITGMVSKTLNTVTGGASGKLSNWIGTKLDDARLAVGLPTSNLTADSAIADATKLGEDITSKGIEINPQGADTNFVTKDVDRFASKSSLLNPSETPGVQSIDYTTGTSMPKPTPLSAKDIGISFKPQGQTLASVTSSGNTTDIITGFEKDVTFVGANDIELTSLKPTYTTVSTSDLTKDQLYQNNRLSKFQTNLSNSNGKILKGIENNPNFSNFDLLRQETAQLAKVASGGVALEAIGKEEEMTGGGGVPYAITALPTDVNTSNDYSKAYAQQYAQAGYTGPQTMQGFAQAGFYGGDPYSFSQVLRNNKVAVPSATVRI